MSDLLFIVVMILFSMVIQLGSLYVDNKIFEKYGKDKQRQCRLGMFILLLLSVVILSFFLFDVLI